MRHATGMRSIGLGAAAFLLLMAYYGIGADAPALLAIALGVLIVGVLLAKPLYRLFAG